MNNEEARAICDKWVDRLGYGFHPDTPAEDYVRLGGRHNGRFLNDNEKREYTKDMERLFAIVDDPYGYGVEAMERRAI